MNTTLINPKRSTYLTINKVMTDVFIRSEDLKPEHMLMGRIKSVFKLNSSMQWLRENYREEFSLHELEETDIQKLTLENCKGVTKLIKNVDFNANNDFSNFKVYKKESLDFTTIVIEWE